MYRKKYIDTKRKVQKKKKMAMQGNITVWVLESYFQNRKKWNVIFKKQIQIQKKGGGEW